MELRKDFTQSEENSIPASGSWIPVTPSKPEQVAGGLESMGLEDGVRDPDNLKKSFVGQNKPSDERVNQETNQEDIADERVNQERKQEDSLPHTLNAQQQEPTEVNSDQGLSQPVEQSSTVPSTPLKENKKSDRGEEQGIELNKTPQKKPKRKKHRPKVVRDGKPKTTPKPVTPKQASDRENPSRKRNYVQYVRRSGPKVSATPRADVEVVNPATTSSEKCCKRALNFASEGQAGDECPDTALVRQDGLNSSGCDAASDVSRVWGFSLNVESLAEDRCEVISHSSGSESTLQFAHGLELEVENLPAGLDLNHSMKQQLDDYNTLTEISKGENSNLLNFQATHCNHLSDYNVSRKEPSKENMKVLARKKINLETNGACANGGEGDETPMHQGVHTSSNASRENHESTAASKFQICVPYATKTQHNSNISLHVLLGDNNCTRKRSKREYSHTICDSKPHSMNRNESHLFSNASSSLTTTLDNGKRQETEGSANQIVLAIPCTLQTSDARHFPQCNIMDVSGTSNTFCEVYVNGEHQSVYQEVLSCMSAQKEINPNELPLPKGVLGIGQMRIKTKRRSKGSFRVRNLASIIVSSECSQLPPTPLKAAIASYDRQESNISQSPQVCMEALAAYNHAKMKRKRRTKRGRVHLPKFDYCSSANPVRLQEHGTTAYAYHQSLVESRGILLGQKSIGLATSLSKQGQLRNERSSFSGFLASNFHKILDESFQSQVITKYSDPIDEIVQMLKFLNINGSSKFLIAQAQNALVRYGGDGKMVPYEGPYYSTKKRRPRSKVDLDLETDRVWKLLMWKEGYEDTEGMDATKEKWWEEERRLFHGRANSFIARMHLVQGDRRFSQWKGSVLDSVVGVFLTQNVSDHLSSSAFMALAARFPLRTRSNDTAPHAEKTPTPIFVEEDGTIKWPDIRLSQQACGQGSLTLHESEPIEEKEIENGNESFKSHSAVCKIWQETCQESQENRKGMPVTMMEGADSAEVEDRRAPKDVISSQNSTDSPIQVADRIGSNSESNSEAENLITVFNCTGLDGSISFTELLQMTESKMFQDLYTHGNGCIPSIENFEVKEIRTEARSGNGTSLVCSELKVDDTATYKARERDIQSESTKASEPRNHSNFLSHLGETLDLGECSNLVDKQEPLESKVVDLNSREEVCSSKKAPIETTNNTSKTNKGKRNAEKKRDFDWDSLRREACGKGAKKERSNNAMDSLDWEAVRCAEVDEISNTIRGRGMNNRLAERIKDFLNRLLREHGSLDLEWLRDVPPGKAKEYLLSIWGLGLKSVECVRLLTLHHHAFPVDTNVGRICVRLGWVPLQPLPESLQLHLLEMYPMQATIQKYLWPRLCKLDQRTLYELHYQMITFGKVFCTKSKPNCNACPMRAECKHFASAFASARLALPGPEEKSLATSAVPKTAERGHRVFINPIPLLPPEENPRPQADSRINEQPESRIKRCEPIIEEPATPEPERIDTSERAIEDAFWQEDPDEIPTIKLNFEEFTLNIQNYMQENNMELRDGDMSNALVALTQEAASIPMPKLKNVSRLRTEHQVYELPDSHHLLAGLDRRGPDDPCSYLLAIWTPGETEQSTQPPDICCNLRESGKLCDKKTCFACSSIREANSQTVRGTLLIPCRTAMRGSFPLNGTYFQVNEVFADHDSSLVPIDVPRAWIWNLPRRTVYFGTSIPTIFKGLTTEGIQHCFWRGYVCVRGFDQKTRAPRPLIARLHFPASKLVRTRRQKDSTKSEE
ncbi:DNA glycosylase/AP lyase ROS1-like isoform X2 [Tasmannia lanceolata]|uniref:DNA glycosylase/AP lyase ROS1-like isoform X2 n=1 Tax=Tasmannia lanceolata TaxID=3420 RepID=UPI0040642F5F